MTPIVELFIDSRGWATLPEAEVISAILQARLEVPLPAEPRAHRVTERWSDELPTDDCVLFLLITQSPADGGQAVVKSWLVPAHRLYGLYTDAVKPSDIRKQSGFRATNPGAA